MEVFCIVGRKYINKMKYAKYGHIDNNAIIVCVRCVECIEHCIELYVRHDGKPNKIF